MGRGHIGVAPGRVPGAGDGRWWVAVAVSILFHAALGLVLWVFAPAEPVRNDRVRLAILDRAQGEAARQAASPEGGQIVDLPRPEKEQLPPPDARFLSRWNTRVDREQRARHPGRKEHAAPPQPRTVSAPRHDEPGAEPRTPKGEGGEGAPAGAKSAARQPDAGASGPSLKGGLGGLDNLLLPGPAGSGRWARQAPIGNTISDDAVLGVDNEGDGTLLNSRSFKYWDFFQRIKERVRAEWVPGDVYRARDPYGKVYGTKDRLTVLAVVIDADGRVVRMEVSRESGLPFLDDEARRAFREAGPFPNPPKGLADDKGRIAFHFGFLLELSTSRTRFFWQGNE